MSSIAWLPSWRRPSLLDVAGRGLKDAATTHTDTGAVMADDEVTPTNRARKQRESTKKLRGELPKAEPGSLAEQLGYAPAEKPDLDAWPPVAVERGDLYAAEKRRAWHKWRRSGIGGSDIAAILGWGYANQSPYQVWAQKTGLIPSSDDDENERYEFGRRAESMLVEWFQDESGLYVANQQDWRTHPDHPWAIATIDGEVFEGPHDQSIPADEDDLWTFPTPLGGFEAKTASTHGWKADDPIPDMYQCQGQWAMAVNGWERIWFAVLHEHRFRTYELLADADDQRVLLEAAEKFWTEHVLTGDPPAIDSSRATRTALDRAYRGAHTETTTFMPEHRDTLAALRECKAQVEIWKKAAALQENLLKSFMGDATAADFGNGVEITWSRYARKSVDTALLKNAYPEVYDACVRSKPSSTFRVKGAREDDE
jgi:putative phage-type endonuclease